MKKKTSKNKVITKGDDTTYMEERFCNFYLFGLYKGNGKKKLYFRMGNATMSYAQAYGKDLKKKGQENVCAVEAHKLLRNPKIKKRMREILQDSGFNDEIVDARINEIIVNGSNKDSNIAIKTYNELMKRVEGDKPNIVIVNTDKKDGFSKALEYLKKK